MSDKDKVVQSKNIPKDGQVILAIMKEMGITEYDPKCVVQLMDFVYKYATNILEEARMYANNNSKKKIVEVDDVRLAIQLSTESSFTTPPPREVTFECANVKNYTPLPLIKPHCGLRLPPDRYCLSSSNYTLKSTKKKPVPPPGAAGIGIKMPVHKTNVTYIKKTPMNVAKQAVHIPKPIAKITNTPKATIKPKIIISSGSHNVHTINTSSTSTSNNGETDGNSNLLKRKREDEQE